MKPAKMTITELADTAGVSRRAVRFYVARRILDPPEGSGRGGHYTAAHLQQLQRIQELQQAGHTLEAIRQILSGGEVPAPPPRPRQSRSRTGFQTRLYTRLPLAPGLELHFDVARHQLTAEQILALREGVQDILARHSGLTTAGSRSVFRDTTITGEQDDREPH